jgi:hypothetical protein
LLKRRQQRRDARRAIQQAQQLVNDQLDVPDFPTAHLQPTTPGPPADVVDDFLPPDLRQPGRDEIAGMMMPYNQPLIVDGEVRTCPDCGSYRSWVILSVRDEVWLHCPAAHYSHEPALDTAWFNRNSGPVTNSHNSFEDGLRSLGH